MGRALDRAKASISDLKEEVTLFERFKAQNPPETSPRLDLAEKYEDMLTDIQNSVLALSTIFDDLDREYRGSVSKMLLRNVQQFSKDFFQFEEEYNNGFLENFIKDCDKWLNNKTLRG